MKRNELTSGESNYSEASFLSKLKRFGIKAGKQLSEKALSMYFCLKDPETPTRAKLVIMGALGYFILPTDMVCDLSPLIGFTDDLTVLVTAYNMVKAHLKPEHIQKAAMRVADFLG